MLRTLIQKQKIVKIIHTPFIPQMHSFVDYGKNNI
jgi:hypothetical protein